MTNNLNLNNDKYLSLYRSNTDVKGVSKILKRFNNNFNGIK